MERRKAAGVSARREAATAVDVILSDAMGACGGEILRFAARFRTTATAPWCPNEPHAMFQRAGSRSTLLLSRAMSWFRLFGLRRMRWAVEGAPGSHVPVAPLIMLLATPLLASCSADRSADRTLVLSECRLPKLAQAAQCGTLEVPENRAQPDGRKLGIFVAVLPANTLSPKPDPLVILAGGPGQAASTLGPFASLFSDVRRTRDIVLIDQRGTGRSSPLTCKSLKPEWRADFESDINPLPKAKACVAELQSAGVDPAQYTTTAWVDDLEAVRKALGYARLNLWGGSYGTRVALEYLRRHPDRVRTLILDGVAPPSMKITLDVWTTRDAALTQIIAACRASKECVAAHPDPAQTLAEIERNLGPTGKKVSIVEPRSGETIQALITYDLVLAVL